MPQLYTKPHGKKRNGDPRFAPDESKYLFNIDTFWFNARSYMYEEIMSRGLRDILIAGREYASENHDFMTLEVKLEGYKNPLEFNIQMGQAPHYQYSLRNDSIAIYFTKSERETGSLMKVQINQFLLWDKGIYKAYQEGLEVLKYLGFLPYELKMNRIDFAVHSDQFDWDLKDVELLTYPSNIANDNFPDFRRVDLSSGRFGTYYHGTRQRLFLRLYDKSKEILDNKKYYFNQIYHEHDMNTEKVWNFEIEVGRDYLRDLKEEEDGQIINIFDDLEYCFENDGLSKLWSHLINKYYHPSKHWTILSNGDLSKFNKINNYNLKIEKDIDSNYDREINQIRGRLVLGVVNEEDTSIDNAIRKFKERYFDNDELNKRTEFENIVRNKKSQIHSNEINKTIKKEKLSEASHKNSDGYIENLKLINKKFKLK